MMACPDASADVEQQMTAAMQKAATKDAQGTTLELGDASGALQVSYAKQ